MKAFVIAIAFAILLLTYRVPARAQKLEVLQYSAASIAVLEYDWYKDLRSPIWYCHSCFDDQSRYSQLGPFLWSDSNRPRSRHPGANSIKEEASPEFVYRVRLRNEGDKRIRAVEWEYIFTDRDTQKEVARHQFLSEEKVRPGKRTTLSEYSGSPPTKVISLRTLLQPDSDRFIEKVIIKRVIYKDGSIWEN